MRLKRFLLFSGHDYEARGGWRDLMGSFESLDMAENEAANCMNHYDWYHIVDTQKIDGDLIVVDK